MSQEAKKEEFERILEILRNNKVSNLYDEAKGFLPYLFERSESLDLNTDIESGRISEILVVQHYEKVLKKGKNFTGLADLLRSNPLPIDSLHAFEKFLNTDVYNTFYQDLIFLPGKNQKLIFPSNPGKIDDVLEYQLNRYFGNIFEFNIDPLIKITPDVLEWLLWKVKKFDGGFVGTSLQITEVDEYDSAARFSGGSLKVNSNGIEDNPHSMLSMACDVECKGLGLSLIFNGDRLSFDLYVEGGYSPKWGKVPRYDDNSTINRVFVIEKISQQIIPYIYKQYIHDKDNWDLLRPQIKKSLSQEVNSLL